MYFVYIIKSESKQKTYTGMTSDINRRVEEHNKVLSNTRSTRNIIDFKLLFCTIVENRQIAREIEKYLKSGQGREFKKTLK